MRWPKSRMQKYRWRESNFLPTFRRSVPRICNRKESSESGDQNVRGAHLPTYITGFGILGAVHMHLMQRRYTYFMWIHSQRANSWHQIQWQFAVEKNGENKIYIFSHKNKFKIVFKRNRVAFRINQSIEAKVKEALVCALSLRSFSSAKIPVLSLRNEFSDPDWYCLLTVPTRDDNVDDVHNDDDDENAFE